uniref:Uncharacterized protein n=1 Tax=Sphaerodactylus townsendi TaxID=933632 RepID=A0ACB8G6D0_9SAUR
MRYLARHFSYLSRPCLCEGFYPHYRVPCDVPGVNRLVPGAEVGSGEPGVANSQLVRGRWQRPPLLPLCGRDCAGNLAAGESRARRSAHSRSRSVSAVSAASAELGAGRPSQPSQPSREAGNPAAEESWVWRPQRTAACASARSRELTQLETGSGVPRLDRSTRRLPLALRGSVAATPLHFQRRGVARRPRLESGRLGGCGVGGRWSPPPVFQRGRC